MLRNLVVAGHVQPISQILAESLRKDLEAFQIWYVNETDITFANCKGLDGKIRPVVERILHLRS
jgi:hypothetical protein